LLSGMRAALRLVWGAGRTAGTPPPPSPEETAARRLVEEWLDTPFPDTPRAVDDLVARIARALTQRGLGAVD
jgi:hypothetical protein